MTINRVLDLVANTSEEVKAKYAEINGKRDVARFSTQPTREGHVCIVGGGPSLVDCIEDLRKRKENGQQVWATNNTFAFLVERGILPDVHVLLDAREEVVGFLRPTEGVRYYLNVSCHPKAFEHLAGHDVVMYDLGGAGTGTTVGLKSMYLAGFSGFRNFHLFGMDSSYRESDHHAYPQVLNDGETLHDVTVDGRKFRCAVWMIVQAEEFQQIAASYVEQDCVITVSGDGLLPFIARRLARQRRILTAVYDLAVSPPTYDFISFLGEAEKHRQHIGAEGIDIIFMPGPADGFRDDTLPDGYASRYGMLYRVCVAACRLVPTVRNVELLKERRRVEGTDIFPIGYQEKSTEIQHYGASFHRGRIPVLQASEFARMTVARLRKKPYVTITLRQSSHWPQRNSNMDAWARAANYITACGFDVAWVPDVESEDANQYSWDTDLRLALYEGAAINLGVNNGPMCMLFYTDLKWIIFRMVTKGIPWTERPAFEKWGIEEGPCAPNGYIVFEPDDYETIVREFTRAMEDKRVAA